MLSTRRPKKPTGLLPVEAEYLSAANSLPEVERQEAFYDIAAMTGRSPDWVRRHANAMRQADQEMRRRLLAEQAARVIGRTPQTNMGPKPAQMSTPIKPPSLTRLMAGR